MRRTDKLVMFRTKKMSDKGKLKKIYQKRVIIITQIDTSERPLLSIFFLSLDDIFPLFSN